MCSCRRSTVNARAVCIQVIMATNRADTLDPALLRPGRLDRKIEFPMPDRRQKRLIFSTITSKMNLSDEVDLEDYISRPDRVSGADINAICQEVTTSSSRRACRVTRNHIRIFEDYFVEFEYMYFEIRNFRLSSKPSKVKNMVS